jgi:hypothetical protein
MPSPFLLAVSPGMNLPDLHFSKVYIDNQRHFRHVYFSLNQINPNSVTYSLINLTEDLSTFTIASISLILPLGLNSTFYFIFSKRKFDSINIHLLAFDVDQRQYQTYEL